MRADISSAELVEAFSTSSVTEVYGGPVVLTDLRETLKTDGRLLVVRGDLAYSNDYNGHALTPKLWVYENMVASARIQNAMRDHPNHAFFDGVGPSGLEALHFHARRNTRKSVVVVAQEFRTPPHWDDLEVIRADEPLEWGYVRKQAEVLRSRTDLIFLNQALYAAKAMSPVGNRVVRELEKLDVRPDATVWCMASGSCLYGIGSKIAERFPATETLLAEHSNASAVDSALNLADKIAVRAFARRKLGEYFGRTPPVFCVSKQDQLFFPLHPVLPNRYMLQLWKQTGETGVSRVLRVAPEAALRVHGRLRAAGFNWTHTTALALEPAIRLAEEGKNVVAMVYGANRNT